MCTPLYPFVYANFFLNIFILSTWSLDPHGFNPKTIKADRFLKPTLPSPAKSSMERTRYSTRTAPTESTSAPSNRAPQARVSFNPEDSVHMISHVTVDSDLGGDIDSSIYPPLPEEGPSELGNGLRFGDSRTAPYHLSPYGRYSGPPLPRADLEYDTQSTLYRFGAEEESMLDDDGDLNQRDFDRRPDYNGLNAPRYRMNSGNPPLPPRFGRGGRGPFPPNRPTSKGISTTSVSLILLVVLMVLAVLGYFGYNLYKKKSKKEEAQGDGKV